MDKLCFGIALQFVQGREFLSNDACPYAILRGHLIERFIEKQPAQYHYSRLQDATQEKGKVWRSLLTDVGACARRLLEM